MKHFQMIPLHIKNIQFLESEPLHMLLTLARLPLFFTPALLKEAFVLHLLIESRFGTDDRKVWVKMLPYNFLRKSKFILPLFSMSKASKICFIYIFFLVSIHVPLSLLASPLCLSGSTYHWERNCHIKW